LPDTEKGVNMNVSKKVKHVLTCLRTISSTRTPPARGLLPEEQTVDYITNGIRARALARAILNSLTVFQATRQWSQEAVILAIVEGNYTDTLRVVLLTLFEAHFEHVFFPTFDNNNNLELRYCDERVLLDCTYLVKQLQPQRENRVVAAAGY
jgi:hypothetical protein